MIRLIFFILILPLFSQALIKSNGAKNHGRLISTNVGRVQNHIITSREVIINHRIDKVLFRKSVKGADSLEYNSRLFQKEVPKILMEWAVFLESKNFAAAEVSEIDIKNTRQKAASLLQRDPTLKSYGAISSEVQDLVDRKLKAKKFIRFKANSSMVPISDGDARAYFAANRQKFGNLPFDRFKKNIKTFLRRQQEERRLQDWFEILRSKYQVKNFLEET